MVFDVWSRRPAWSPRSSRSLPMDAESAMARFYPRPTPAVQPARDQGHCIRERTSLKRGDPAGVRPAPSSAFGGSMRRIATLALAPMLAVTACGDDGGPVEIGNP